MRHGRRWNAFLALLIMGSFAAFAWITTREPSADSPDGVAPILAGQELTLLSGSCAVPADNGAPPAGCSAQPAREPRIVTSAPGRLPLSFTAGVLSMTVASGPLPDAIELLPTEPGKWEIAFPDAPAGSYQILLTTDVAQVASFTLVVTPAGVSPGSSFDQQEAR